MSSRRTGCALASDGAAWPAGARLCLPTLALRTPCPKGAQVARSAVAPKGWWRQTGSNRRPHACKARALPTELCPLEHSFGKAKKCGYAAGVCDKQTPRALNPIHQRFGTHPSTFTGTNLVGPAVRQRRTNKNAEEHQIEDLVGRGGLEPPTSRLSGVRSNHLSYRPIYLGRDDTVPRAKRSGCRGARLCLPQLHFGAEIPNTLM